MLIIIYHSQIYVIPSDQSRKIYSQNRCFIFILWNLDRLLIWQTNVLYPIAQMHRVVVQKRACSFSRLKKHVAISGFKSFKEQTWRIPMMLFVTLCIEFAQGISVYNSTTWVPVLRSLDYFLLLCLIWSFLHGMLNLVSLINAVNCSGKTL